MSETEKAEVLEFRRKRRISCLIRILVGWFSLLAIIIIGMVFIRSNVERKPEPIDAFVSQRFAMDLPQGFQAYSMSSFFRTTTISYWDQEHLREDGRTTSLIAMYSERKWRDKSLEEVAAMVVPKLKERLERNSFHTDAYEALLEDLPSGKVTIHRFGGQTRMDEQLVAGTTCFRFVMTPDGPYQIQTMGFERDFPEAAQIAFLKSIRPIESVHQRN